MALSPATGLANYSAGISSSVLHVDSNSDRVGIGTTNPQDTLQVGTAITMGSGAVTATQGNFQSVSIAGTLTYEDVSSIDAVGIITAQSGITITGGGLSVVGDTDLVGNLTGVNATGISSIVNATSTTLNVTGVTTISNTVVGGATTQLVVNGDARITGILTMGTSSITLDGTQNKIISGKYDFLGISTSHTGTAVDVFVYDTSKDSDGGEWRKRTSDTSWYNETLGTATRGSRKEFPAVAVIVAEATKVTIYDGDDPDLPMWMVFDTTSGNLIGAGTIRGVTALNGIVVTAASGYTMETRFISDYSLDWFTNQLYEYKGNIEQRNDTLGFRLIESYGIVNSVSNDVAITVLPNAPIDSATGLPIPTIAVATESGVSVIKDDGNVVDLTQNSPYTVTNNVFFSDYGKLLYDTEDTSVVYEVDIPSSDIGYGAYNSTANGRVIYPTGTHGGFSSGEIRLLGRNMGDGGKLITKGAFAFDANPASETINGLTLFDREESDPAKNSLVAFASTSYNTGWMHGDIKLATLSSNVGAAITFTNLSTNGDLADSSDLSSWTAYNATLSHQTDAMRVADNGEYSKAYQSFTTEVGKKYIASVYVKTISGLNANISVGSQNPAQGAWNNGSTNTGGVAGRRYSVDFTATTTTSYIELGSEGGSFVEYQDVRIDEVKVEDRSVNDNPLELYGTITKTAVATGADLVAYSGFSASNYLQQPYNSDLAPGTAAYIVSCWFKTDTSSGDQYIFDRNGGGAGSRNLLLIMNTSAGNANKFQFWHRDNNGNVTDVQITDKTITDNIWHQVVALNDGTNYRVYVDGEVSSVISSQIRNVISDNDPPMFVGIRHSGGSTFMTGSMALFRYSKSAPSPEQIKKIYDDEKYLFQENSQATLYGSSDAVTALAYDEVIDQLHVGTSSGRSDFQGLRRINNTTTAVTTAISAHDTFIIEQ